MTFDASEVGIESGRPIELYTFRFGTLETQRYTSHDVDVEFMNLTYTTEQIDRTNTAASREDEINRIQVTLPSTNDVAQRFIGIIPGTRTFITIVKTHQDEIGGGEDSAVIFDGYVASCTFNRQLKASLKCRPNTSIFQRPAPRFNYTSLCNHVLYDARCKVDRSSFQFTGLCSAVSGDTITVNGASASGADFFVGGMAKSPAGSRRTSPPTAPARSSGSPPPPPPAPGSAGPR